MFSALKKSISNALRAKKAPKEANKIKFDYAGLCVRVGSELVVSNNNMLIYDSVCTKPTRTAITNISITSVQRSTMYRLYLGPDHFVQILINAKNEVEECRLFSLVRVIQPSTSGEWLLYLQDRNYDPENLPIIGRDEVFLDDVSYCRLESWASPEPPWVEPLNLLEKRYGVDGDVYNIDNVIMAYGRWLHEGEEIAEYLLISSEEVVLDGPVEFEAPMDCAVRYYVGLDISIDELSSSF